MTTKICQRCEREYQPTGNDQKYCPVCGPVVCKADITKWRQENSEHIREYNAKWAKDNPDYQARYRKENPDTVKAAIAKWRKENPDKVRATGAKYRKDNPEKVKAKDAKWCKANPEKRVVKRSKRRAAKYDNTPINELLTSTEWLAILAEANGHCAYCGKESKLTLDHVIPLSRGGKHSKDNVVAACVHCNCSKGNRTLEEWHAKEVGKLIIHVLMVQCPKLATSKEEWQ